MGNLTGTTIDRVNFDVERGKIKEFVVATGARDEIHTRTTAALAAGFADALATATHVVVAGHQRDQQAFVAALGLDLKRVVVGSVAWEYERPLAAGDSLVGTRVVVSDTTKSRHDGGQLRVVTLETSYADSDGAPVLRQREVLIERGEP